jgi:hypothetical protein
MKLIILDESNHICLAHHNGHLAYQIKFGYT